ncbi:MAG: Gfo/Idh/MocA family oxidoreductase [Ignavibacteriaceae bacterium]|nr:Gfo/Idh/MocA family oxidoreductase [Ignavibacteriaceae bacterium]
MFKSIENCELVGIYDSNMEQLKAASEDLNVQRTSSIEELLKKVDAISIAATTTAHFEIAKKCFEYGVHVFIEKPITTTIKEAEELVEISAKKNLNYFSEEES